ncbi:MAG: hypothetical protein M0C28_36975 [Candidatus Moduliflexus flocculans]|nr:hypothetical protein [Candidatus Moduliflexus flocculans]
MSYQRLTRRAETVRALVLLVSLLGAGCGGGSPSPMPPTGPGTPPPGGGCPQPIGTMTRGPYLQHADDGVTVAWYTEAPTEGQRPLVPRRRHDGRGRLLGGHRRTATRP